MLKKDSFLLGFISGLIAPVLAFLGYYEIKFNYFGLEKFWNHITGNHILAAVISMCLIVNLALFFLFLKYDCYKTSRGVIGATFIYGFIIVYLKIF